MSRLALLRRLLALPLALAALLIAAPPARAGDDVVGSQHWNMECGGPDRTSRVTCEPIRRQPKLAWKLDLPGGRLCDPVVWDGTVFVLSRDDRGRNVLLGIDARTGEERARKILLQSTADIVSLVVWQGTVVMTEPDLLQGFLFKGDSFTPLWKRKGDCWRDPGICRDLLLVYDGRRYNVVDLRRGRDVEMRIEGAGLASVTFPDADRAIVATVQQESHPNYEGVWLSPCLTSVTDLGKRTPSAKLGGASCVAMFDSSEEVSVGRSLIAHIDVGDWGDGGWFVWNSGGFLAKSGTCRGIVLPDRGEPGLVDARVRPAIYAGRAYTFDKDWDLLSVGVDGSYRTVVASGDQPARAWRGEASIAQNVAYFGNWAVDLDTRRVLWVRPFEEDLDLPTIPAGDGLAIVMLEKGGLRCLADPRVLEKASALREAAATAPPTAPLPTARSGVLLRDGSEIEGTVTRDGDTLRVLPPNGDPVSVPVADVLVATNAEGVVHSESDGVVYATLERAARGAAVAAYEDLFDQALRMEIPNAAGSMIEEGRAWGMTEDRAKELSAKLTGKRMHPNADIRREALLKRAAAARTDVATRIVACAAWARDHGLPHSAGGLLGIAQRLDGAHEGIEPLAKDTMPEAFPWRDAKEGWRIWLRWAAEMLPADARLLAKDDPAWQRCTGVWTQGKGAFGFRTPHLLLFALSEDVSAVGPCLRYGEAAVTGLQRLLDHGEEIPVKDDADRLDVRIHRDHESYLAERTPGGGAPIWSVGYYSPSENVSRFFVPRVEENHDPLGRTLFKVLAHELTHHYVDARWVPRKARATRRSSRIPGFWVVEGLARFVEDQMVDSDTRGLTFDDNTVESIDATSQLLRSGDMFVLQEILDMTQDEFARLGDKDVADVTLRRSLVRYTMSERSIFYEQAGALTFFLLRRKGEAGRKRFIDYLLAHYTGKTDRDGWRMLGFNSERAMTFEFSLFLQQVR